MVMNQAMFLISQLSLSPSHHHTILPRLCSFRSHQPTTFLKAPQSICQASRTDPGELVAAARKTNYLPSLCDYSYMKSLTNGFDEEEHREELEKMKEEVKGLIKANQDLSPLRKLELIDSVQQLGLHYHFEEEIQHALGVIHKGDEDSQCCNDLYATALRFRLLRQQGFRVPQDVFKSFMDEAGNFRGSLCDDPEGLLSLYEASFLGLKGEEIIDKAMEYSSACLKAQEKSELPKSLAIRVDRALDMPLHWRCNRLQARWFMDMYKEDRDMNPTLLKLAKLDFNIVQSIHMKEIHKVSRWWVELGMTKFSFARDFINENYMFSTLMLFHPKYPVFRVINAKIAMMILLMDDVYDAYGSLQELELLTDLIDRWDITEIDKLPHLIKACFMTLYNTTNEIGHWAIIERGINIIPELRKEWADLCKAFLVEAKWCHEEGLNPPTLKEYLNTAVESTGGQVMHLWCYMATADTLSMEALDVLSETPRIVFSSSTILRLVNDLATSTFGRKQGDNIKAVECYMNEMGEESEEAARGHIENLVLETWKTMNEDRLDHQLPLSTTFVNACLDHARGAQYFYQHSSGHEIHRGRIKDDLISLFAQHVPMD